jgi:hypothetical protein
MLLSLQEDRLLDARLFFSRFNSRLRAGKQSSISSSKMESRESARSRCVSPIDSVMLPKSSTRLDGAEGEDAIV